MPLKALNPYLLQSPVSLSNLAISVPLAIFAGLARAKADTCVLRCLYDVTRVSNSL